MTGDWDGKRTELADNGYTFFAYFNGIVASNVSGGIDSGTALATDLYAGMTIDLQKAMGWKGWTFNLSGIDRAGASIDDDVGGIYSVMQLVGGQTYFLYNLSLEKTWADVQDLVRDFGYSPSTPVEQGVKKFVDWYRSYYGK